MSTKLRERKKKQKRTAKRALLVCLVTVFFLSLSVFISDGKWTVSVLFEESERKSERIKRNKRITHLCESGGGSTQTSTPNPM